MRFRQVISLARREVRSIVDASKVSGGRKAVTIRARHHLELDDVDGGRIAALEHRLSALENTPDPNAAELERLRQGTVTQFRTIESHLAASEAEIRTRDTDLKAAVDAVANAVAAVQITQRNIAHRMDRSDFVARIDPVTRWISAVEPDGTFRISVLIATRNRTKLLRRAVESVRAQEYSRWELVVVDDGSTDGTARFLKRLSSEDDRIVVVTQEHRGVGAARNAGLAAARGDVVCYLDDDNVMLPLWLKAVAWTFERQSEADLLYGARVMEVAGTGHPGEDCLPTLQFEPFDRDRLEAGNFIDLGVIAHRRALPEARFDESLQALGDWDLLLRLTERTNPLPLPVVASIYTTSAPDRISAGDHFEAADATIRLRSMGQRPLRVLAYNSLFPLVPETYIADEMKGLTDNGAVLAWCTDRWSPSPVTVAEPTYTDLDTAVRTFDPDVLVVFWAAFAAQRLDHLGRAGKPFALRVHSFDFALEDIDRVRAHPLCVGVWAYPHHAHRIDGAHGLVPLLTSGGTFPEPGERTIVLSASAALPKKDWPLLVAAFAELADKGVDCRIVVGLTDKHEDEPDTVRQLIRHSGASIKLSVDVPHDQVIELLGRTAVVVYSKVSGGPFGMPRSIIEGMYAGTSVILPDRPEAPLVAGPGCRTYRRADDIVGHCLEVLAGGRDIESERRRNRRFAADNYADPDLATMFTAQLARALTRWRAPH